MSNASCRVDDTAFGFFKGFWYSFLDCNSLAKLHNTQLTDDLTVKMFLSIIFFAQLFGTIKKVCSASEENIIY